MNVLASDSICEVVILPSYQNKLSMYRYKCVDAQKNYLVYGHLSDWMVKSVEFRNFLRVPSSQAVLGGRSREGAVYKWS